MKGKFLLYAILVSLLSTVISWGQFFASLAPSTSSGRGSNWSTRTGTGGGVWGNGTGGTSGAGGGGHK